MNETPELDLKQLNTAFEKIRREWQSSKDRSVQRTNERLDAMQSTIEELRLELLELQSLIKEYLVEEVDYVHE